MTNQEGEQNYMFTDMHRQILNGLIKDEIKENIKC